MTGSWPVLAGVAACGASPLPPFAGEGCSALAHGVNDSVSAWETSDAVEGKPFDGLQRRPGPAGFDVTGVKVQSLFDGRVGRWCVMEFVEMLVRIGLPAAGVQRPDEDVDAYVDRVVQLGAKLFAATQDVDPEKRNTSKMALAVAEAVNPKKVLLLKGVLLDVVRRGDGKKWDLVFLPAEGDFRMKFVDPTEGNKSPRPTYDNPRLKPGLVPATEIWHTDIWVDSDAGEKFRAEMLPLVGRGVDYRAWKDPSIWQSAKGDGYRVFGEIVGMFELPQDLAGFSELVLKARRKAAAA